MRDSVRAELLKACSGFWMLAVLAYAILLPLGAWRFAGRGMLASGASAAEVSRAMLVYLIACPIAATFVGSYLVTRDYYYKSITRAVLTNRKDHVYAGKLLAGAGSGLAVGMVGSLGWLVIAGLILRGRDQTLLLDGATAQAVGGCAAASVLAGVLGVAIGWIVPNYYAATSISMLLPLAVEVPLALAVPEIARFLPDTALAGVAQAQPVFPGIFGTWTSLPIAAVWVALAAFAGWRLFERREIR
ncbi:hypothetical protein [Amycolatopsis echigonensis]|uniref:Uncharacterized protein n=1 Tax=Amycolatopsis echigonensis TaxID=2576905 RepID=A0A8E1W7A6_9PSEU|nr:hypothetical protein [Amycolatopsis echigonensis]MBB2505793.1 hypothetical protein [Amycolatopsis echigonensis]